MAELKPTDKELAMIANAYCRLQMGVEKCGDCTGYKNWCCGWCVGSSPIIRKNRYPGSNPGGD